MAFDCEKCGKRVYMGHCEDCEREWWENGAHVEQEQAKDDIKDQSTSAEPSPPVE